MIVGKEGGIVTIPSKHSVDATVDRLKNILRSKEITLFALIDHSGEAAKVGMKIPPTKLLIFGNPKGAPLSCWPRRASPLISLSRFWLQRTLRERSSYNSPEYLKERYGLPSNLLSNIAVIETIAAKAGE